MAEKMETTGTVKSGTSEVLILKEAAASFVSTSEEEGRRMGTPFMLHVGLEVSKATSDMTGTLQGLGRAVANVLLPAPKKGKRTGPETRAFDALRKYASRALGFCREADKWMEDLDITPGAFLDATPKVGLCVKPNGEPSGKRLVQTGLRYETPGDEKTATPILEWKDDLPSDEGDDGTGDEESPAPATAPANSLLFQDILSLLTKGVAEVGTFSPDEAAALAVASDNFTAALLAREEAEARKAAGALAAFALEPVEVLPV